MPAGKYWNRTLHKWVKRGAPKEARYDEICGDNWALLLSYWRWYPDRMLAMLEGEESDYSLTIIQSLNLRALARCRQVFITGSRGTTKTYVSLAEKMVEGVLWPGEQIRYFGPALNQTAEIGAATFEQIRKNYPVLADHWLKVNCSKDSFEIKTGTGSEITITAMRGDNAHQVLCEEVGQENAPVFDHEKYRTVVLPAIRLKHNINKKPDLTHIDFKKQYITSASRQQNETFQYRCQIFQAMCDGENAFAIDYPWQVAVLSGVRDLKWAEGIRPTLTPEEWLREMESIYTGVGENPVIRDEVLTEAKKLMVMETHHCQDPDAIYVIGYDVSHEEGARHAMCATSVVKLKKQKKKGKEFTYLKQLVYVNDSFPKEASLQAQYLKDMWRRYSMEGGGNTYIVIDNRQYGKAVTEQLMKNTDDGVALCCWNHAYPELEQPDALPVIYPIVASTGFRDNGNGDPEGEMLKYAETQFENGNVQILTTDINGGVESYKKYHNLKTSDSDASFSIPYAKCKEMCGQIMNLEKKMTSLNWSERRKSKYIQRDMWSAFKYALRFAQLLERRNLVESNRRESDWEPAIKRAQQTRTPAMANYRPRVLQRRGRLF